MAARDEFYTQFGPKMAEAMVQTFKDFMNPLIDQINQAMVNIDTLKGGSGDVDTVALMTDDSILTLITNKLETLDDYPWMDRP